MIRGNGRWGVAILLVAMIGGLASGCGGSSDGDLKLDGTNWKVDTLGGSATIEGSEPTMTFVAPTELWGSTGCNQFLGTWKADGSSLTLNPGATTLMSCGTDVDQQQTAFTTALSNTRSAKMSDQKLELRDDDGKALATLVQVTPAALVGPTWRATAVNNGTGGVESVSTDVDISAVFGSDNRLTGNSGCNGYSAGFTVDGSSMTIEGANSTLKACQPQEVMDQEAKYQVALSQTAKFEIDATSLTLLASDGSTLVIYKVQS